MPLEAARPLTPARPTTRPIVVWTGRGLSALPIAMFLFSAALKLSGAPQVAQMFVVSLGYPAALLPRLAALEIACVVLYAVPRTSVLGAVLLAGYAGGAMASHVRIGESFVVPALLGLLVWAGLYLRDERLRALLPFRTSTRAGAAN